MAITPAEIAETRGMVEEQNLDIRTITMGVSLMGCGDENLDRMCTKIYDHVTHTAEHLVETAENLEREYGIPIVNKRVSVTPVAQIAAACPDEDLTPLAHALDRAAEDIRAGRGTVVPEILRSPKFKGYRYPHDYENDYLRQEYLPEDLRGRKYYEFGTNKTEQAAKAYWDNVKSKPDRKKSPGK